MIDDTLHATYLVTVAPCLSCSHDYLTSVRQRLSIIISILHTSAINALLSTWEADPDLYLQPRSEPRDEEPTYSRTVSTRHGSKAVLVSYPDVRSRIRSAVVGCGSERMGTRPGSSANTPSYTPSISSHHRFTHRSNVEGQVSNLIQLEALPPNLLGGGTTGRASRRQLIASHGPDS